jgi:hypothetical protein
VTLSASAALQPRALRNNKMNEKAKACVQSVDKSKKKDEKKAQ